MNSLAPAWAIQSAENGRSMDIFDALSCGCKCLCWADCYWWCDLGFHITTEYTSHYPSSGIIPHHPKIRKISNIFFQHEMSWRRFFRDRKGVLLVYFMPKDTMVYADRYCATLRKLRRAIQKRDVEFFLAASCCFTTMPASHNCWNTKYAGSIWMGDFWSSTL